MQLAALLWLVLSFKGYTVSGLHSNMNFFKNFAICLIAESVYLKMHEFKIIDGGVCDVPNCPNLLTALRVELCLVLPHSHMYVHIRFKSVYIPSLVFLP